MLQQLGNFHCLPQKQAVSLALKKLALLNPETTGFRKHFLLEKSGLHRNYFFPAQFCILNILVSGRRNLCSYYVAAKQNTSYTLILFI